MQGFTFRGHAHLVGTDSTEGGHSVLLVRKARGRSLTVLLSALLSLSTTLRQLLSLKVQSFLYL